MLLQLLTKFMLVLLLLLLLLLATDNVAEEIVLLLLHTIGDMLSCSAFSISHAPMSQKIYHTLVAKFVPSVGNVCVTTKCVNLIGVAGVVCQCPAGLRPLVPPAESETWLHSLNHVVRPAEPP